MRVGSLFSGIGGLDLGLERAGHKVIWQSEIDPYACRVLKKHWPDVPNMGDITRIDWSEVEQPDFVCGGDPCQENSRARTGCRTTQPSLGHEFIRAIAGLRPGFVLRENPANVRTDAPWPWQRIRFELRRLGYIVLPFRLRACCLGADHQRDRLFLLASMGHPNGFQSRFSRGVQFPEGCSETRDLYLWPDQPEPSRVANGIPYRVDRNRILGNALPPAFGQFIGQRLNTLTTEGQSCSS